MIILQLSRNVIIINYFVKQIWLFLLCTLKCTRDNILDTGLVVIICLLALLILIPTNLIPPYCACRDGLQVRYFCHIIFHCPSFSNQVISLFNSLCPFDRNPVFILNIFLLFSHKTLFPSFTTPLDSLFDFCLIQY